MSDLTIHIRPAGAEDAGWITALVPRLHEFGPPPWREVATTMNAAVAAWIGHVVDLVVAQDGEGHGVGRALLAAAERWAEKAGYPWLTLHVFEGNDRARRVYEQVGYVVEWTRMLKPVGPHRPVEKPLGTPSE